MSICLAAAETFPKECAGGLFSNKPSKILLDIDFAIPYQLSRRTNQSVVSTTGELFSKLSQHGKWTRVCDFHSHPFQYFEEILPLGPSRTDIESLRVGDVEVIVRVQKSRSTENFIRDSNGSVRVGMGKYRFLIKAFQRTLPRKELGYKDIRVELAGF